MANTKLTLSKEELFQAIFEYVEKHYPNVNGEHANIIKDRRGMILRVEVDCSIDKE